MSTRRSTREFEFRDAGYVLAWILGFALVVPVQTASMILFDMTGLDAAVPDLVFLLLVPAAVLALLPTLAARSAYCGKATGITAGVAFVAFALANDYVAPLWTTCGAPMGC